MAALDTGDVREALHRVLDAVEWAATELGVVLPDRRYATVGGAVYDCAQVSVSGLQIGPGLTGATAAGFADLVPCDPVWNMSVEIAIVRCANEKPDGPRGELPPKVEWVEADVEAMSADAAVLAEAASALSSDPAIVAGAPTVALQFTQPQGGLVAVSATITFNPFALPPVEEAS